MTHPHPSTDVEEHDCSKHDHIPECYDVAFWHCKVCGAELYFLTYAQFDSIIEIKDATHQATLAEVVGAMLTSDKLYGFQIVVTKDLNDKRYIAGFEAGKEFMKDRIKAIAAKYSIPLTDDKPEAV